MTEFNGKCWRWGTDKAGRTVIFVRTPAKEVMRLYVKHAPKNWAEPGDVVGWDGCIDHPTLSPSIKSDVTGFHGYLRGGKLYDAAEKEIVFP